ncbi:BrnA antitoxin family protein [Paracoccus liaowanqingii]|uniref:BrnA antitoxin family protein n=1 Tax=Paracoccus liaowanqingii TaxID=2560053 RepID=A0A4P7HJQ5_9RHOB|nr:BrnA antitoxin family protein [Paracoccus liaowanqingii]QBX33427.1 BrnA antitoxin family protein [Paracoccus liaowanqingii]
MTAGRRAGGRAEEARRANYHYMADAMRMLEWDLHSTVLSRMRIPDEWHRIAQEKGSAPKTRVTLRLDSDVVAFFRSMGPDWQVRVNRLMAAWMHARLAGLIEGAETMDYLARREEAALDGPRPEFGDLQRDENAAWAEMGETPPPFDGPGVPMEGPRRMSEAGKRALLEEMKGRRGF